MSHVTREQLEAHIEKAIAANTNPAAGIYGPDSSVWRLTKEALQFLGGGRAVLMQMAHPFVAQAIEEHSATRSDPQGRFQRTFEGVHAVLFGDLATAERSARRMHAIHERVRGTLPQRTGTYAEGTSYDANDEDALLWVMATLVYSAVDMYERVMRPLTQAEKEQHWEESKLFGYLFGISDDVLPDTWDEFESYYLDMVNSAKLAPSTPAKEIAELLFDGPNFAADAVIKWYKLMTTGLLPAPVREAYGLPFGPVRQRIFNVSMWVMRVVWPRLPARMRYVPAYVEARRRLKGLPEADRFGRLIEKGVVGALAKRAGTENAQRPAA